MEIGAIELTSLKDASEVAFDVSNKDLAELQLAFVACGGGGGDVFVG